MYNITPEHGQSKTRLEKDRTKYNDDDGYIDEYGDKDDDGDGHGHRDKNEKIL